MKSIGNKELENRKLKFKIIRNNLDNLYILYLLEDGGKELKIFCHSSLKEVKNKRDLLMTEGFQTIINE